MSMPLPQPSLLPSIEPFPAWRSLLRARADDSLAAFDLEEQALAAVDRIRRALGDPSADWSPPGGSTRDHSLAAGKAGEALFWAALNDLDPPVATADTASPEERCEVTLQTAVDLLAQRSLVPGLFSGYSGTALVVEHLLGQDDDFNEAIDAELMHLLEGPWQRDYDLISGLVGFGVYALERARHGHGDALLERVLDRIADQAQWNGRFVTWHTPPHWLHGLNRERFPKGYFNLGLAHGVPGIIALLANCRLAGRETRPVVGLLAASVDWLLTQCPPDSLYPCFVADDLEYEAARSAWCYGNPGIAISLLLAGRALGDPAIEHQAMNLARAAARRTGETSGVRDASLCHGSAGLAHMFNRLYQATGCEECAQAARHWFHWTLTYGRDTGPNGENWQVGFPSWIPDPSQEDTLVQVEESSLLYGMVGVGLALIAALGDQPPLWDRAMLLDLPSAGFCSAGICSDV